MSVAEKISVSLDPEVLAWVRSQAEAAGLSVSAFVAEIAKERQRFEARKAFLKEAGGDEIPIEELRAAEREMLGH